MRTLAKMYDVVYDVLTEFPETRDSDYKLFLKVCDKVCENPSVLRLPFDHVLKHRKELGVPNFESVGRARRKVQEEHILLRSSAEVQTEKNITEEMVLDFVRRD